MAQDNRPRPKFIDISSELSPQTPVYPGDPAFERRPRCDTAAGHPFELSSLSLSAHAGAHLDAPRHFFEGARTIDGFPPESFFLAATVVAAAGAAVTPEDLSQTPPRPGGALLFRTRNSLAGWRPHPNYRKDYAYLSLAAARRCLELGAALVGIDYLSVDRHGDEAYPVHRLLLGAGRLILEGLDLSAAPPGDYGLICLPLKIRAGEASPVRALLVPPDETGRISLTFGPGIH
ncbi:hypothetical protein AAU61_00665 [Desulfocarbo indianensis]|nr:hypothetical protein AAU61_00665 [Desulfocarbo indianensis]